MGQIQELADRFRSDLLAKEAQAVLRLRQSYRPVYGRLDREITRLTDKIQQAGPKVDPVWLYQVGRLRELRRLADQELERFGVSATRSIETGQKSALKAVNGHSDELLSAALGPQRSAAAQVAEVAVQANFSSLGEDALAAFVGRASDGGPLAALLSEIGRGAGAEVEGLFLAGVATGRNPLAIAADARRTFGVPLQRAERIARTEVLNSYREATRSRFQENRDVIQGWTWVSVLARTTCPACWVMHGSRHSVEDRLDGHPNCRCVMAPLTRSWEELGFSGLPDTRPVVEDGETILRRQPAEFQRAVLGTEKAFTRWQAGELRLADLLARKDHPRWGTMRYTRSVRQLDRGEGGFEVGPQARGGLVLTPPPVPAPVPAATVTARPTTAAEVRQALLARKEQVGETLKQVAARTEELTKEYAETIKGIAKHDRIFVGLPQGHPGREAQKAAADALAVRADAIKEEVRLLTAQKAEVFSPLKDYARELLYVDSPADFDVYWGEGYPPSAKAKRKIVEEGVERFKRYVGHKSLNGRRIEAKIPKGNKRAFYLSHSINLDAKGSNAVTVIHELGHWFEDSADNMTRHTRAFLNRRTTGDKMTDMRTVTKSNFYDADEKTQPDKFRSPYVGRRYQGGGASEVISMGVQWFDEDAYAFAAEDPDHFDFVFNVLRGLNPDGSTPDF